MSNLVMLTDTDRLVFIHSFCENVELRIVCRIDHSPHEVALRIRSKSSNKLELRWLGQSIGVRLLYSVTRSSLENVTYRLHASTDYLNHISVGIWASQVPDSAAFSGFMKS